jgi:hypothetical protein
MPSVRYVAVAFLTVVAFTSNSAIAVNIRQAGKLRCATTIPVDGYCECTAHGNTDEGTAVSRRETRQPLSSTAAGCGAQPGSPGCR